MSARGELGVVDLVVSAGGLLAAFAALVIGFVDEGSGARLALAVATVAVGATLAARWAWGGVRWARRSDPRLFGALVFTFGGLAGLAGHAEPWSGILTFVTLALLVIVVRRFDPSQLT